MKTRTGIVAASLLFALSGLAVAASAQGQYGEAQNARPRDVLALQQDLNDLDQSYNQLQVRQRQRFEARINDVRNDVTNMRSRMNDRDWQNNVTRRELDDMRARIASLQGEMYSAQTRRSAGGNGYGYGNGNGNGYGNGARIPAGTELDVRLDQTVSSRGSRVEERVEATTVTPVVMNGRTVVPIGSVVTGYVAEVDDADRVQRDGRLRLEFNSIQFPNGTRADIRSRVVNVETQHVGRSTGRTAGLGAILGGVLGGVIGGGRGAIVGAVIGAGGAVVATRGQNVELPEGTHLVLRLDDATVLAQRE